MYFDPSTIATFSGTLTDETGHWNVRGHCNHTGNGLHFILESDTGESFYAMLGPWWFMAGQGVRPVDGRRIEIHGSVVSLFWSSSDDRRFVIATEITIGAKTAFFRDEWGYPLWHGTQTGR